MPTFAELFCRETRTDPARYEREMLARCVHRRARLLVPVIRCFAPDYFAPDDELVRGVGVLTSTRGLKGELQAFDSHPRNRGFCRRRLKVRISAGRVTALVRASFAEADQPAPALDRATAM